MDRKRLFAVNFGNTHFKTNACAPMFGLLGIPILLAFLLVTMIAIDPVWGMPGIIFLGPTKKLQEQPVIVFSAGKTVRSDRLPTEFVESGMLLRLNLTADTGVTPPTYRDEAPWNIIRAFRLIKDGETVINISGEALFFNNYLLRGQNNPHFKPTTASQADAELKALYVIPYKMIQSGAPQRTYISGESVSNWHLEVDFGDGDTLASANIPTDIKGNLEISTLGFIAGQTAFPESFRDPVILPIERNFSAATKTRIELNRDFRHRASIIRVSDEATGHVLSDTKLKSIRAIQVGTVDFYQAIYPMQAFLQGFEHSLTEDYDGGTPTITESEAEGYLFGDWLELGFDDALDGAARIELEVDVLAATRLNIYQIMFKKQPR